MGNDAKDFDATLLPEGVRSRYIDGVNGMRVHILEAGFETPGKPCVLLLHGFPELAYSWRKVMLPIAESGFHVVAPDQRGYGWTEGWDGDYHGDLHAFSLLSIVRDTLALVFGLGRRSVAAVVGHDFGSPVAAFCALARPDVFQSVALMSAPFGGAPTMPSHGGHRPEMITSGKTIHQGLAELPRPRKHYQWYYSSAVANDDMLHCEQGVHAFLRAYFHHKSADWPGNQPFALDAWSAEELAKMPTYYIMDLEATMAETVATFMPTDVQISANKWLPDNDLAVFAQAFERTGFQGGLQWYRCVTDPAVAQDLTLYAGRTIGVPSCFIAGSSDWGIYQKPGDFERMQNGACATMTGCHLIDGAGHWVQQEQPDAVCNVLLTFLKDAERYRR